MAGRIEEVDPSRFTCTVVTEVGQKRLYDVDFCAGYLHAYDGEGMYVMPEPGAAVWVARSSEGDYPAFVLGYRAFPVQTVENDSKQGAPNLRNNRPRMAPGDMILQTRDRNGLRLRRGGVTEIFGSAIARTIYSARKGLVRTLAQNFRLDLLGGSLKWLIGRKDTDPDGRQPVTLEGRVKEFSDDRGHIVQLDAGAKLKNPAEGDADGVVGTHGPAPQSAEVVKDPALRLRVFEDGDKKEGDLQTSILLALDKDGNLELAQTGELGLEVRGSSNATLRLKPNGNMIVDVDGQIDRTAGGSITEVAGGTHTIRGGADLVGLAMTNDGLTVKIGLGTANVVYDLGYSEAQALAFTEISVLAKVLGLPTVNIDNLIQLLQSKTFTAKRLETE
jgi:hypothetical protein